MSNNNNSLDQCIALAGLAQSVRIVQHLAWKGKASQTDLKSVVSSLLRVDASSAAAVYGGSFEVSTGLRVLNTQLDTSLRDKDPLFANLAINIISLQRQLNNNKPLMDILKNKIEQLANNYRDMRFYTDDDEFERLINDCSDIYKATLSQLSNRIQVKGDPKYLKLESNQAQVRAALLAAIRACFLWRQSGGSRWHFIFKKNDILKSAQKLISAPINA